MSSGLSSRASYRTAQQPSERTRNRGGVFLNPQLQWRRFSPRERALTFGGQPSGVSGRRGETESGGERLRRAGHHTYTVNVSGGELPPPGRTSEVFVVALADTKTGGVSGRSGGSVSVPRPPRCAHLVQPPVGAQGQQVIVLPLQNLTCLRTTTDPTRCDSHKDDYF